jgi:tRNA (cytidine56-2'-O)-methyltransferase
MHYNDSICSDLIDPLSLPYDVHVLRIGHRPERDKRITSHVALVARAFGCRSFILGDIEDLSVVNTIEKVVDRWGGSYFIVETGINSINLIKKWKRNNDKDSCIVHLTMYGIPITSSMKIIKKKCRKILVIVGAEKVPSTIYELADYNVSVGLQPHSEVSALALFLDRLFDGMELCISFSDAKLKIAPMPRDKKIIEIDKNMI